MKKSMTLLAVLLGLAALFAFWPRAEKAQWVTGKLVEQYTEDEQSIAVLRVTYQNPVETNYYLVEVPKRYLEASDAERRRDIYTFDMKQVPREQVRFELEYSVAN
jgi:hypothetical protein